MMGVACIAGEVEFACGAQAEMIRTNMKTIVRML
jgi:hypothetical protein